MLEEANPSPAARQQSARRKQAPGRRRQALLEYQNQAGIAATPEHIPDVASAELSVQAGIQERRDSLSDGAVSAPCDRPEKRLIFA